MFVDLILPSRSHPGLSERLGDFFFGFGSINVGFVLKFAASMLDHYLGKRMIERWPIKILLRRFTDINAPLPV